MLIVSLVVLEGLVLFLGGLVLLVVCSGINGRVEVSPQRRVGGGIRDAVLRSVTARVVTQGMSAFPHSTQFSGGALRPFRLP